MKKKIVSILLIFILLQSMIVSCIASTKQDEYDDTKDKIDEATDAKKGITAEKKNTLEDIADLEDSISGYQNELNKLNSKIKKLEGEIKTKGTEIKKLQKEFDDMQQLLTDRLVAIYEEGQVTFLDVLLSAESVWDYIAMPTRVQELTEADNNQMEKVENQRQEVEKAKKELETQQTELNTSKKSAEAKKQQLQTAKASKETKVAKLSADEKKVQKQIDKYKADLAAIQAEIEKELENANGSYNGSFAGRLSWPLSSSSSFYNEISSKYGARESPVPGASTYHRGIDIPVRSGTPVYASADGYVLSAKYNSARGYYVLIKHADNLYTLYQHLSSYNVSVGQNVKRGQKIASSGSSGIGSGPHLHYEIWTSYYYTSTVNPLTCGYISLPSRLIYW